MTNKRGQAALEFLSTYGFAFLIILVMVGALTYFGVLSPSNLVPARCLMGENINCKEYQITRGTATNNASMLVSIQNDRGKQIEVNLVSSQAAAAGFGNNSAACTVAGGVATNAIVAPGSRLTVYCNMDALNGVAGSASFPARGEKVKVIFDFQYRETGNSFWQPLRAEVTQTLS